MNGGSSGESIVPFDHFSSELWIRIDSGQMPPGNNDLTPNEVDLIAEWIDEGALQESSLNGDLNGDLILNVLDTPYESIESAIAAAKEWGAVSGIDCSDLAGSIGIEVKTLNGSWRTICYS